jgi:hypothetical protein
MVSLNTDTVVDVPADTGFPTDKNPVLGEAIKEIL